jgi:Na+-transporting NADH:ubiquinone oxidoreductase subunit C
MSRKNPICRLLERPNSDPVKSIGMAAIVAACCALIVSVTAVALRPKIEDNRLAARAGQMSAMLEGVPGIAELLDGGGIETFVVDLDAGRISDTDPATFDQNAAAADPDRSIALSPAADLAAISRRENEALVWMVREKGEVKLLVLPVRGAGYQSTIWRSKATSTRSRPSLSTSRAKRRVSAPASPKLNFHVAGPARRSRRTGRS